MTEKKTESYDVYEFMASCVNIYGTEDHVVLPDNVHEIEGNEIIRCVNEALTDCNLRPETEEFARNLLSCLYRTKDEVDEDLPQDTNDI